MLKRLAPKCFRSKHLGTVPAVVCQATFFAVQILATNSPDPFVGPICSAIMGIKGEIDKIEVHRDKCGQLVQHCDSLEELFQKWGPQVAEMAHQPGYPSKEIRELQEPVKLLQKIQQSLEAWNTLRYFRLWLKLRDISKQLENYTEDLKNRKMCLTAALTCVNTITAHKCRPGLVPKSTEVDLSQEGLCIHEIDMKASVAGLVGDIHLAQSRDHGCLSAKHLRDISGEEVKERFSGEIQYWKAREHPNLLKICGVTTALFQGLCLISKYQSHGNIFQYYQENPNCNALRLLAGAAAGVAYIHECGHIHGNLRCTNILITDELQAAVHDFEVLRVLNQLSDVLPAALVRHQEQSTRWCCPEILCSDDQKIDGKSDVWSLGMTMIELFSGARPFGLSLRRPEEVLYAVVNRKIPGRPDDPTVTDAVWNIIVQCLSYHPEDRPSMLEVQKSLTAAADVHDQHPRERRFTNII